jgi:hypothetical protein
LYANLVWGRFGRAIGDLLDLIVHRMNSLMDDDKKKAESGEAK